MNRLPGKREPARGRTRAEMAHSARAWYESGIAIRDIANLLGRSYGAAHALLREANTPLRTRWDRPDRPTDGDSPLLRMKAKAHRDAVTVRLVGVFDFHTCATLPAALGPVLARDIKTIRLDGSGLRFCDTGAVNTLLRLREAAIHRDVALRVCRPSRALEEIIELTETRSVLLPCPGTRSCQCFTRPAGPHPRPGG